MLSIDVVVMATPEIGLPAAISDSTFGSKGNLTEIPNRALSPEAEEKESVQGEIAPIVYHYLKFETELPLPTSLGPTEDGSPTPGPPDLCNFVSPFTWSESRKTFTTWLSCLVTVVTAYTAGSYSSAGEQMSREWGVSQTAILVGITTFATGFGDRSLF